MLGYQLVIFCLRFGGGKRNCKLQWGISVVSRSPSCTCSPFLWMTKSPANPWEPLTWHCLGLCYIFQYRLVSCWCLRETDNKGWFFWFKSPVCSYEQPLNSAKNKNRQKPLEVHPGAEPNWSSWSTHMLIKTTGMSRFKVMPSSQWQSGPSNLGLPSWPLSPQTMGSF